MCSAIVGHPAVAAGSADSVTGLGAESLGGDMSPMRVVITTLLRSSFPPDHLGWFALEDGVA